MRVDKKCREQTDYLQLVTNDLPRLYSYQYQQSWYVLIKSPLKSYML